MGINCIIPHASSLFSFFCIFCSFKSHKGIWDFFPSFYATKKILHIGTTGYMLVLKNHKICLNRHERIFYFFFLLLMNLHKEFRFTWKRNFFLLVSFFSHQICTQKRMNESNYNIFFLLILLLSFYSCDFFILWDSTNWNFLLFFLRIKKMEFDWCQIKNLGNKKFKQLDVKIELMKFWFRMCGGYE